ncbi:hypothetical protein SORDD20_00431 [Streptococcus oralis]|nr:hypothetical protein SORDD20_00431 [Streptococcus oralis]
MAEKPSSFQKKMTYFKNSSFSAQTAEELEFSFSNKWSD